MSRPQHPSRLRRGALAAALAVLPAVAAPAAASASFTTANTWAGGGVTAARDSGAFVAYPKGGALVSLVTGPSTARLYVSIRSPRCVVNGTLRGTVTQQPGGSGDLLALSVTAKGTRTTPFGAGRTRARLRVELGPAAPGVLGGTVTARGTTRIRGRSRACSLTQAVRLTSRAVLTAPAAPFSADPAAPRVGVVSSTISPRVKGAIAITRRADGTYHGLWSLRERCVSGSRRTIGDYVNVGRRFPVRANGAFRGREVSTYAFRQDGERVRGRYVATISGRIGPDGVARGRVAVTLRQTKTGNYLPYTCRTGSLPFAAAP